MSAKHTPGPWHYQEEHDAYTHIVRASGNYFIAQLSQDSSGVSEANARLIAAAPDLLEACGFANAELEEFQTGDANHLTVELVSELLQSLKAAIAKAEGATA